MLFILLLYHFLQQMAVVPGRKLDKVWDYFDRQQYKRGYQGKCMACSEEILGKKDLLKKHLADCALVDDATKKWAKEDLVRLRWGEKNANALPVPLLPAPS